MVKELLGCMVTRVSKNGSVPCGDGSSTANWMCGSWLLTCWSSDLLCSALVVTKMSSTNLSHREGGWGQKLRALTSNSSMNRLAVRELMGEPMAAPWTCSQTLS